MQSTLRRGGPLSAVHLTWAQAQLAVSGAPRVHLCPVEAYLQGWHDILHINIHLNLSFLTSEKPNFSGHKQEYISSQLIHICSDVFATFHRSLSVKFIISNITTIVVIVNLSLKHTFQSLCFTSKKNTILLNFTFHESMRLSGSLMFGAVKSMTALHGPAPKSCKACEI